MGVELLDLPDELILAIMNEADSRVFLLCSIIGIGNHRLERLAMDQCRSIDLTRDCAQGVYPRLMRKRLYSHVMPRIIKDIRSLTMNICQTSCVQSFVETKCNESLPGLTHLKIMVDAKHVNTGVSYTLGNYMLNNVGARKPLVTVVPEYFFIPNNGVGKKVSGLCRSSLMRSVQTFELDENCILTEILDQNQLRFDQSNQLTNLQISFSNLDQCVYLLKQLGAQLHSLTVNLVFVFDDDPNITDVIQSISCPHLKQLTMKMYRNFHNYQPCLALLARLSNVESLTLCLAIGKHEPTLDHFIDGSIVERHIRPSMPRLRQLNYHIRSVVQNASHLTIDQIRSSFVNEKQPFNCVIDHFKNNFGQCHIYSLPFVGTRLDFVSNRFPLIDQQKTFANVTLLLLFDDLQPFERHFFERLARALPRLRTLEIINQLEQQEQASANQPSLHFAHLSALILYETHMNYAQQFLCHTRLPSLVELAINKNLLFQIISENQQQARDNASKVERLLISEPSHQSIELIQKLFPLADYIRQPEEA